jgi:hypothetical protein
VQRYIVTRKTSLRAVAVMAVSLFGTVAPDNFEVFDRAFVTLFTITGGDPWPESLPWRHENGSVNWLVTSYFFGYTLMVIWVILQVGTCAEGMNCPSVYKDCIRGEDLTLYKVVLFRCI